MAQRVRGIFSLRWLAAAGLFAAIVIPRCFAQAPTHLEKPPGDFVTEVAIDNVIQLPAHLFNLHGKTLRFTPLAEGGYKTETLDKAANVNCDKPLDDATAVGPFSCRGWLVPLPFQFPFGGKSWDHVYVNRNGNISFEKPEGDYWPQRDPWADGGMRSMAAVIDSRAAAGMEQMIAVLWATYDTVPHVGQVSIKVAPDYLAVTWNTSRADWGQARAGINIFQARLFRSGVIELVYPRVADHDGIVGLFTGQPAEGERLHHWEYAGKAADPSVDIDSCDIFDAGSVLKFVINMKNDAITSMASGTLKYETSVERDGHSAPIYVEITDTAKMTCWLNDSPRTAGFKIHGKSVEMYISKVDLRNCREFKVGWGVNQPDIRGRSAGAGRSLPLVDLSRAVPGEFDFSAAPDASASAAHAGNIFEVFHYPQVTKGSETLLKSIYQNHPADDDIAIVFTDFRLDDLYGQGGGAIPANVPIKGIGKGAQSPRSTRGIGSTQLQMSIATTWIGAPIFAESGVEDDGRRWFNFSRGVKWAAHECTHRWGMGLMFHNPHNGQDEKLVDGVGHWREELNTEAAFPVGSLYVERSGTGHSIIGGAAWHQNSDGTFGKSNFPFAEPGGYSALDLYAMGLLPAEKVPDTFLIDKLKDLGNGRYSGVKVPVRIADVVSVMGPRIPDFKDSQRSFRMAVYLVSEPGKKANPQMLAQAKRLSGALANFFTRATGGVMKIVPSGS